MAADSRRLQRLRLVEQHVDFENTHDLDGVLGTFGATAFYKDEPWCDTRNGRPAVRDYYAELMRAVPDLRIVIERRYVTDDNVILQVRVQGTHLHTWRGLPATGRRVDIPLCGIFDFDENDRLAGETIYYDRATVLQQLGVFYDPQSLVGSIVTACTHPVTMLGIARRSLTARRARLRRP